MALPSRQQVVGLLAERAQRHRRVLKGLGIFLAVVTVLGFLVAPPILRSVAEKQLTGLLHRPVTVADVDLNPFALSATVEGFSVAEPDGGGEALGFDRLYVNLEAQSLFRLGPVLREVQLAGPRLKLRRGADGRYNWQDLIDEFLAKPASEEQSVFAAHNIQVSGGQIEFDDQVEGVVHRLTDLQLGLPFISSIPSQVEIFVEPVVAAKVNGRPFALTGQARPFSEDRESTLEIKLQGLELPGYLAYLPFEPAFKLPGARLSTDLAISFKQPPGADPQLSLKGSVTLADVELQDKAGAPVLKLASLGVDLADSELIGRKLHLARVRLESPQVEVRRAIDGAVNLLGLVPPPPASNAAPAPAPAAPAKALVWQVDRIEIAGGQVGVTDASVKPAFATRVQDLQVEVEHLGSEGDPARIKVSLVTDAGEKMEHDGHLRTAAQESEGQIKLSGLLLPRYLPYAAEALPGGEVTSGKLDATLDYSLSQGEKGPLVKLRLPGATLSDLAVRLRGEKASLVQLARLELADGKADLTARSASLGRVVVERPQLALLRDKAGRLNAENLLGEAEPATPPGKPARPDSKPAPKQEPAWTLGVGELAVREGTLRLEDRSVDRPTVLLAEQLGVTVQDFSTAPGAKARVAVESRINQKGRLAVKGSLALAPLAAELDLDLQGVDVLSANPYLAQYLQISLSRGSLTTRGKLALELPPGGEPKGRFTGDVRFLDLATIDRTNASDFVKWKSLSLDQVDLRLAPFALAIREVALTDFYTRLILDEQGELNLREITARPDHAEPAAAKPEPPPAPTPAAGKAQTTVPPPPTKLPPLRIDRIALKGGNIAYSDRFIKPNYNANLTGMGGTLVGLSSDPSTIAQLELQGRLDNAAPVNVVGKLNPFRQDRYLDIRAEMRGFDLPGLSSYSGKYVGYGIEKGKLSAVVSYKVEDRKLTASNRIFLDQLTFGEKVESPDALKLPVLLAVSLLKNGRGEIDIDLPISGSLDDPEFSVGGIVFKAIMNLLVKAVTAPFTLLGSLFGGGEDLAYVEFGPGLATLSPAATDKLQAMAKALADRPAIEVELAGRVDPVADQEGLKREAIRRQMAAFKIQDQVKKGEAAPSLDEVVIDPAEYSALLKRVYKEGDFKKPRNLIGLAKDLPDAEMEALLLQSIAVTEEDLRSLGQRRGQQVKDWLLDKGQVAPERLFVLSPRIGEDGKEGAAKTSRVDFTLK